MGVTGTGQVRCRRCDAENSPAHLYCGVCGVVLDELLEPAVARLGGRQRAYPRLFVISGLVFVVSTIITMSASYATAQAGPWDFGLAVVDSVAGTNLSGDGGSSTFIVTMTLMLAFIVAGLSFLVFVCTGTRLLVRRVRRIDYGGAARAASEAADTGKRTAATVIERGGQELAEAKPKIAKAAARGRTVFDEDVAPRISEGAGKAVAGAGKAAARSREWIARTRHR